MVTSMKKLVPSLALIFGGTTVSGCGICEGNATIEYPDNVVPLFGNFTDSKTCNEYDAELSQVATEEDCFEL